MALTEQQGDALPPEIAPAPAVAAETITRPRIVVLRLVILIVATALLLAVHYHTPVSPMTQALHDLHRHILYIPIILAGFWHGWRGGIAFAVGISLLFFPHLLQHLHHAAPADNVNRALEIVVFLVIGGVTGGLSDRLRAKERRLAEALERLRRSTAELFETERQLRRADRLAALGQLSAGLAHEIRNPLASIRGAAEILGDDKADPATRAEFSKVLIEETERLDLVLRNFMDYARVQRAGAAGRSDAAPVLERVRLLLEGPLRQARVKWTAALPSGLPPVAIAENLLQQVFLNLALNAIQAMTEGGELRMIAEAEESLVRFTVADSGPGIPADLRERVFDPFFTTKAQGTGLGLSIIHRIIANHGGRIFIGHGDAPGARLVFELPIARA